MNFEKQMEFLLQNQAHHDAKIGQLIENQAKHDATHAKHEAEIGQLIKMQAKNEQLMGALVESVTGLAHVAHARTQ